MRKVNFLFVGLLFVFITSCKKNDNYRIVNILDGKIKTVSGIGYTEFYYYNQDGIIDKTGHNTDSSYFYYYKKDDTIFLTSDTINYVRNPLLIYDNKKYILENGLAIVKTGSEEIYYYQYNTFNFLANSKNVTDYYWKNSACIYESENLLQTFDTTFYNLLSPDVVSIDSIVYLYDLNKLNSLSNENFGMPFLGKSSKNLVIETINYYSNYREYYPNIKRDTFITNYSYQFDSNDRVIQRTTTTNSYSVVENYTYY